MRLRASLSHSFIDSLAFTTSIFSVVITCTSTELCPFRVARISSSIYPSMTRATSPTRTTPPALLWLRIISLKSCSLSAIFLARSNTSPVAVRTLPEDRLTELARIALATSLKVNPYCRMACSDNSIETSSRRSPNNSTMEIWSRPATSSRICSASRVNSLSDKSPCTASRIIS